MKDIIGPHPIGSHPFACALIANDEYTLSGKPHRALKENGNNDALIEFMVSALRQHHISPEAYERRKAILRELNIQNAPALPSPYPSNFTTQKGNFAEVFLAEYLSASSSASLPIYRLRYNTNPDQSMKGDDVLMFDLDSDPVRVIVGEAKFRTAPSKQSVTDMVDGLIRSNKAGLPISLFFVADRLYQEGKDDIAKKVENCAILFANDKLEIDYVGLLMSNPNAARFINRNVDGSLHNLLAISLGINHPESVVQQAFELVREIK